MTRNLLAALAASLLTFGCAPQGSLFPDEGIQAANDEDQGYSFDSASTEQGVVSAFSIEGTVPASRVKLTLIADKLYRPTGLAFKPVENSLWVVNRGDDSSVIVDNPGKSNAKQSGPGW